MNWQPWRWLRQVPGLLAAPRPDPSRQTSRIISIQRNIVFPAKLVVAVVVFYYLFISRWKTLGEIETPYGRILGEMQWIFGIYVMVNVAAVVSFVVVRRFVLGVALGIVFVVGLADGVLLGGLTLLTGGFDSVIYWVFAGMIVVNAICIPLALPQIALNLTLTMIFLAAGLIGKNVRNPEPSETPVTTQSINLQLAVLWMLTVCCYGVQLLAARQRQVLQEQQEFLSRTGQLQAAGRLAAEIAHKIKNPLGIINATLFTLRRAAREHRPPPQEQLQIIQEEVERSDRIITQIMGYAQLAEGRVEKLDVARELERAIQEVFPAATGLTIEVTREFASALPPLWMQPAHFNEIFVNLLQNAREVLHGVGQVRVAARPRGERDVEVVVADNGAGIPADKRERIFEPYFTNREQGTGLGLAIVKHNVELYGGTVGAESELGKGARFTVFFPARVSLEVES